MGYTNAGKSTLFNKMTGAEAYVANRLFATLDPTLRSIEVPEIGSVILADTVGFIRHLPHDLVDAFYATLEEIGEADLLLHVIDASDERRLANIKQVEVVLKNIGADTVPSLFVYNKIDLCGDLTAGLDRDADGVVNKVWISAQENVGLNALTAAIVERLGSHVLERTLELGPEDAKLRAKLYRLGAVIYENALEDGRMQLLIRMPKEKLEKLFD